MIDDADQHREAMDNLPWLVTGRLDAASSARISQHIDACAPCRTELALQRVIHSAIVAAPMLEHTPQASLAKLETRILELDREIPPARVPAGASATRTAGITRRMPLRPWLWAQSAAVAALTLIVGWMAVVQWTAPRFATASSVAAPPTGAAIRLVLAPGVGLREFEDLVRALGGRVIDGPTTEHAWTVELPAASAATLQSALSRLRSDPRVRLAEPRPQARMR